MINFHVNYLARAAYSSVHQLSDGSYYSPISHCGVSSMIMLARKSVNRERATCFTGQLYTDYHQTDDTRWSILGTRSCFVIVIYSRYGAPRGIQNIHRYIFMVWSTKRDTKHTSLYIHGVEHQEGYKTYIVSYWRYAERYLYTWTTLSS